MLEQLKPIGLQLELNSLMNVKFYYAAQLPFTMYCICWEKKSSYTVCLSACIHQKLDFIKFRVT